MLSAETVGLGKIAPAHAIRVPQPVTHGVYGEQSFLVLEYLDLHKGMMQRLLAKIG